MQKTKKNPAHSSFVRLVLVPCLILAQPVLLHAKAKKQESGRSPAVVKNPMDPILGCLSANEDATRRLSNPKWAVRGSFRFANEGLLVQTVEFQSQTGATYTKDFAWIPTPDGAGKVDVTSVPRNSESYLNQTLYIPLRTTSVSPFSEDEISEEVIAYTPGSDPKPPNNAAEAKEREMKDLYRPDDDLFPALKRKSFNDSRKRTDRGLNGMWMKNDSSTRKVILDELRKRFEEYSIQSERERLAFAPQHPELRSRSIALEEKEQALYEDLINISNLSRGENTPREFREEQQKLLIDHEERRSKLLEARKKLREDQMKVVSDLLKSQTLKDFIQGLRGCKAALEKDQWNQDEEFKSFYSSVSTELKYLEDLMLQGSKSQTPSSDKKSGAGNASGAGQAQ